MGLPITCSEMLKTFPGVQVCASKPALMILLSNATKDFLFYLLVTVWGYKIEKLEYRKCQFAIIELVLGCRG